MQLELTFGPVSPAPANAREEYLSLGQRTIRLWLVPNARARRYVLRLTRQGVARVTVPRRGSLVEARRFVERNRSWLEKQLSRHALQPATQKQWIAGSEVLFRGQSCRLELAADHSPGQVRFGTETLRVTNPTSDLRAEVERHLWRLAATELPPRVLDLAALHGFTIQRVTVRNQRSRWGSCSRRGTISLNWRLIQTPDFVRDYIILHELAHVKHMNHSARFWEEVARLCPQTKQAEAWLKRNSDLLR